MTLTYFRLRNGLLALCAILLAGIAFETLAPVAQWQPPAAPVRAARAAHRAALAFVAPSLSAYDAIDARPVFNPLRTPFAGTHDTLAGTSSGSIAAGDLALIGIIIDHGARMALLRTPDRPLAMAVAQGGAIGSWQVVDIGSDRITLRGDGGEHELLLSANRLAPALQAAAAAHPAQLH